MRKVLISTLFMAFFPVVVMGSSLVWERVDDNSFINLQSIITSYERDEISFMLKAYNKGQYEAINGQNVDYTISQYTIDCMDKMYKIGVIDSYSEYGSFVNGDYNRYAKFRPIVSGTAVSNVADKFCTQ